MNLYEPSGLVQGKVGCYVLGEYHTGLTVRALTMLRMKEAEKTLSPVTYNHLRMIYNRHINPVLGDYEIDYLTQADIADFLKEKKEHGRLDGSGGLSDKVMRDISGALNSAFKLVKWDIPKSSFLDAPHLKPLDEILSLEQADILTKYLTQNLNRCNAGYLLCLYTGIKMSEVCALRDSDFDLTRDRIHIQRTMQRALLGENQRESTFSTTDYPEDYYGNRVLKLQPKLSMLLWSILRHSQDNEYFLSGIKTGSIGPRSFQLCFKKLLPEAGLPEELNFHMLRNTFAWMWLLREDDLEGLTYVMGLKSVTITKMTYSALLKHLNIRLPGCAKYLSIK